MTAAAPTTSRSDRRKLMVGKGWVQAVALVMIFGFFVMGILAYRTYTASMPSRRRSSRANGEVLFTGEDITAGPGAVPGPGTDGVRVGGRATAPTSGPTTPRTTCAARRTSWTTQLRESGTAEPRQAVISEFRTNRYDEATKTLTFTDNQARAFEATTQHYATVLRRGLQPERAGPERDQRPGADPPAHGVLRLDRVGVGGRTARPQLLLHQQLAGRAPGRQQPDGRRDGVERPVARRAARRHRHPVRRLRPLERQGRLAQRGGPGNLVPPTRRGGPDPGPARDGLVLLHDRRRCSWSRRCWARRPSTTGPTS